MCSIDKQGSLSHRLASYWFHEVSYAQFMPIFQTSKARQRRLMHGCICLDVPNQQASVSRVHMVSSHPE